MDVCDPDVKTKNIRKLIKLHTGRKMQIPKDRMCDIMRDISRGKLPLPPLVLTRDKRYLLDPKSPLTKRDYESLYKSRVTSRVVKRIAKKVGLIETDKTIVDLKRSIGRRLASMNVYEPILLPGSRVVSKMKNDNDNEYNRNGVRNEQNVNNEFRNEENSNGELTNEQSEKPASLRNMLARKRQKSRLKVLINTKNNGKTNTESEDKPNINNERRRMEINAKQRIETVKRNANKRIENTKKYTENKLSESKILTRRRQQRQFVITNNALRREQRNTQRAELDAGMARINRSKARFKATINAKRTNNLEKSLNNMKRTTNEATKKMNIALRQAKNIQKRMNNGEKLALKRISSLESTIKETQTQRNSLETRVSELQKKIGTADNKGDTTERNRLQLELNVATKKIAELSKSQTQDVTKLDEEVKKAKNDAEMKRSALKDARNREDEALRQKKAIENKLANNELAANERKKLQNERNVANKAKKNAENERAKLVLNQFEAQKNKNRKNAAARLIQGFARKKATKRNQNIAVASKKLTNNAIKKVISDEGKPIIAPLTRVSLSNREINAFRQKILNAEKAKRIHPFNARRYKAFINTSETLNNTTRASGFKIVGKIEPAPSSRRTARMRNIETADRRLNKRVLKGPSRNALKSNEHMVLSSVDQKKFAELRNSKKSERKELRKRMNVDGGSINTSNDNSKRTTVYSNVSSDKQPKSAMRFGGRASEKPTRVYPINPLFVARNDENIEAAGAKFMGGVMRNNPLASTDNDRTKVATSGRIMPPRVNVAQKAIQMKSIEEVLRKKIRESKLSNTKKDKYMRKIGRNAPDRIEKEFNLDVKYTTAIKNSNTQIIQAEKRTAPVSVSNVKIQLKKADPMFKRPPFNALKKFQGVSKQLAPKPISRTAGVVRQGIKAAIVQNKRKTLTEKVRMGTGDVDKNKIMQAQLRVQASKESTARARLNREIIKKRQRNKRNIRKAAEGSRNAAVGFVARRKASLQTTNAPK